MCQLSLKAPQSRGQTMPMGGQHVEIILQLIDQIAARLAERSAAFAKRSGAAVATETKLLSEPHLAPADGPLVSGLLAAWQEVTGKPGKPVAIGGGTQARLFPGGVDFGPAEDMVRYRGHGTDEYLTPEELHRIAELTVAAVWRLAGPKPAS